MNCKPGDLVVVYRADGRGFVGRVSKAAVGRFATVRHLAAPKSSTCTASLVWILAEPLVVEVDGAQCVVRGFADEVLRPIRNPGDDAVDESKAWLPPVPLPAIDPSLLPAKEST